MFSTGVSMGVSTKPATANRSPPFLLSKSHPTIRRGLCIHVLSGLAAAASVTHLKFCNGKLFTACALPLEVFQSGFGWEPQICYELIIVRNTQMRAKRTHNRTITQWLAPPVRAKLRF